MDRKAKAKLLVKRTKIKIMRDTTRVLARPLIPDNSARIKRTIDRILSLSEKEAEQLKTKVVKEFSRRHKDLNKICARHFEKISGHVPNRDSISNIKKFLLGSYFTMEYSIESAALFNPSIVVHPDQRKVPKGSTRFMMSLRATGEGHISSIVFRTGLIGNKGSITFDKVSKFVEMPFIQREVSTSSASINSNYTASFEEDQKISERVIFPVLDSESKGIEDARFVRFVDDSGEVTYYGTYTAYDGFSILPQLIETKDFLTFKIITLKGKAIQNKGMALFPRKINGKYVMLSRQDGETNRIMFSNDVHVWETAEIIQEPFNPWEFVQIGNCGSPIETGKGWVVLTHGVGPMRQYSIGAILLDLHHPEQIIARTKEPIISPNEEEREGYVPNVVYSCGSLLHNDTLIIPYAMSDITSGVATVNIRALIDSMIPFEK